MDSNYIINGNPTSFGVLMEWIRVSGEHNMITQHNNAIMTACCLGAYLNQDINIEYFITCDHKALLKEYIDAYENKEYMLKVNHMASALVGSETYENLRKKYDNHALTIPMNKLLIEETYGECMKWALFGRDIAKIESLQTTNRNVLLWAGAQLMKTMGKTCDHNPSRQFNFI
jgi:hypothetical protein